MAPLWISLCGWLLARHQRFISFKSILMCDVWKHRRRRRCFFQMPKKGKGITVKYLFWKYSSSPKHKRMNHIKSVCCVWRWVKPCSQAYKLNQSPSVFLRRDFVSAAPLHWAKLHEILKTYFTRGNHKLKILWKRNWFGLVFFCLSDHVDWLEVRLHTRHDFNWHTDAHACA